MVRIEITRRVHIGQKASDGGGDDHDETTNRRPLMDYQERKVI